MSWAVPIQQCRSAWLDRWFAPLAAGKSIKALVLWCPVYWHYIMAIDHLVDLSIRLLASTGLARLGHGWHHFSILTTLKANKSFQNVSEPDGWWLSCRNLVPNMTDELITLVVISYVPNHSKEWVPTTTSSCWSFWTGSWNPIAPRMLIDRVSNRYKEKHVKWIQAIQQARYIYQWHSYHAFSQLFPSIYSTRTLSTISPEFHHLHSLRIKQLLVVVMLPKSRWLWLVINL